MAGARILGRFLGHFGLQFLKLLLILLLRSRDDLTQSLEIILPLLEKRDDLIVELALFGIVSHLNLADGSFQFDFLLIFELLDVVKHLFIRFRCLISNAIGCFIFLILDILTQLLDIINHFLDILLNLALSFLILEYSVLDPLLQLVDIGRQLLRELPLQIALQLDHLLLYLNLHLVVLLVQVLQSIVALGLESVHLVGHFGHFTHTILHTLCILFQITAALLNLQKPRLQPLRQCFHLSNFI